MSAPRQSVKNAKKASTAAPRLMGEAETRRLINRILALAKKCGADEAEVHVEETAEALTRFANNAIHQNVAEHGVTISIRTILESRTARVTTNRLDEDSLRAAITASLSLAHSQPRDPKLLPVPDKQRYRTVRRFDPPTAQLNADERARAVRRACDLAVSRGQVAAGIFASGQKQLAMGNSRGLFASYRDTDAEFSVTMQQGAAASWAKANSGRARDFDSQDLALHASDNARMAQNPQELATGRYTVILEPSAVLDLVGFLFYDFSATAIEDKRSCLNDRIGKAVFGKNISIVDDAYHPLQMGAPWDGEGMSRERITLVERGVVRNLVYSRSSAKAKKKKPTGHGFALPNEYGEAPMNLVFSGGDSSLEEMVRSTERGLLVTRLWYIREVDPYEKVMTGMTRDGLYLVENGKVTGAARNFRFNQSILEMLRNVELMSPAIRATGEESFEMVVPAMKVRNFHFSEVTRF